METNSGPAIVIVGAGNVAFQLGKRLKEKQQRLVQVYTRSFPKAKALGEALLTEYTNNLSLINIKADIYIFCVSDSAIEIVGEELQTILSDKLVVHTSGAISSEVLSKYFKRSGVFYPLQSFSMTSSPDFNKIPICVFSNDKADLIKLINLGKQISDHVEIISDQQRLILHLAAVFVNNFTNHLFTLANKLLKDNDLSLKILLPLIEETVNKIHSNSPDEMQTGPAKRGDLVTINKHLEIINNDPVLKKIYLDISKSINPDLNL